MPGKLICRPRSMQLKCSFVNWAERDGRGTDICAKAKFGECTFFYNSEHSWHSLTLSDSFVALLAHNSSKSQRQCVNDQREDGGEGEREEEKKRPKPRPKILRWRRRSRSPLFPLTSFSSSRSDRGRWTDSYPSRSPKPEKTADRAHRAGEGKRRKGADEKWIFRSDQKPRNSPEKSPVREMRDVLPCMNKGVRCKRVELEWDWLLSVVLVSLCLGFSLRKPRKLGERHQTLAKR